MKKHRYFRITKRAILIPLILGMALGPGLAFASFNPAYIVSDFEYFNYKSLSVRGIQQFLNSQTGALKNLPFSTPNGNKNAAEIIYEAANTNRVSPKTLIATLQKEMSLITNPSPTQRQLDWAMGFGVCDSCSKDDPAIQKYKGFYNQVMNAARLLGDDPNYGRLSRYKVGQTYSFDYTYNYNQPQNVTIGNEATGLLYQYTPYIHGNQLFYTKWVDWFQIKYPDGTLVRADGEPGVYLIHRGKRFGFLSRVAFLTRGYDFRNVIVMRAEQILAYELGGDIDFPNLSFVEDGKGNLYFVNGLVKQKVSLSVKQAFVDSGLLYDQEIFRPTSKKQLNVLDSFDNGDPLKSPNEVKYPTGVLLQNVDTGAIGYVKDGVMHMLHSKDVLYTQFPNRTWIRVSASEFNSFPQGSAVKLRDGTLVRSPKYGGGVYIISNGTKRPITSREVFDGLGFKMENVIKTNDRTMDLHPDGPPFDAAH